jgi:nucleoside-diphosphate-sugar epimerase
VIWLAAVVGDAACALDPAVVTAVNQESVRWLAENFNGRIIFMSTCSVYGAADAELDESSPTNPLSVYAVTKLAAESHLASHPNAIIFRLGTLFGLGDTYSRVRFDLVVNTLTLRAQQTGKITVFGGEQYRPLLHVRDAAAAIVRALDQSQTGVYNLAQINMPIFLLADWVAIEFPGLVVERTPQQFEDNRNYRVSSERARGELGFCPNHSIAHGIRVIRNLLDSGRLVDPSLPRHWNARHLEGRLI